jgi:hypothetical protein
MQFCKATTFLASAAFLLYRVDSVGASALLRGVQHEQDVHGRILEQTTINETPAVFLVVSVFVVR